MLFFILLVYVSFYLLIVQQLLNFFVKIRFDQLRLIEHLILVFRLFF